jgi:hypothetical protein
MNHVVVTAALALALANPALNGQTLHPLSFFPHHLGDIWEYVEAGHPEFYWQNIILADSLGPDGRYYIQTSQFANFIVDTSQFFVYNGAASVENLIYKLDANVGDYWIVWEGSGGERHTAIVVGIYQTFLFGVGPVTVKVIDNYNVYPLDSLLTNTDHIAEGFGLIQQDFDGMPGFILRGAKIDGIVHGTVTSNDEPLASQLPQLLRLDQNYPNPFNPSTTINFVVPRRSRVKLTVFDVLGRQMETLLDGTMEAGSHSVHFDASSLSSGVYYYRLETAGTVTTKKMIVQK